MKPPRLKILSIGTKNSDGTITGWMFSGKGIENATAIWINTDSQEVLHGGYTEDELLLIHEFYHRGFQEGLEANDHDLVVPKLN